MLTAVTLIIGIPFVYMFIDVTIELFKKIKSLIT